MSSSRLPALDVARGMAALAVVLFHFACFNEAARADLPNFVQVTYYGYLGVHLFFLISGFVIFMTLEKTAGAWDFFIARASRLYPAFLLSIALTLVGAYLLQGNMMFSMRDVLLNLTMFPDFLGAKMINGAYWTLAIEIVFYGLVFLAILIRGKDGIMPIVVAWFALSVLNAFIGLGIIERLLILKWAPLFTGGAALYFSTRQTDWRRVAYLAVFVATLPVAAHYALGSLAEQRERFSYWQTDDVVAVSVLAAAYALMAFIAFRPNAMSWLPPKFVEVCGGASYILYLIHQTVGSIMVAKLYPYLGGMAITLVVALMVAVSALIYMYFDKPVQRKLRIFRRQSLTTSSAIPVKA